MKQFFKMFFASLLAMIVAGVVIVGLFIAGIAALVSRSASSEKETIVEPGSVLTIDLGKTLHEQGEDNSIASFSNDAPYNAGLYDATRALTRAAKDDHIKGVLLKLDNTGNGWATLQQLKNALNGFKSSHKFIYAYGEGIPQKAYYVASVADSIFLNPVGALELKGLASQITFYKGALEKLEIKPEIFFAGKFKSATEPFRADKISDANRIQLAALQTDIWSEFLQAAAAHSHSDTAAVHQLAATGAVQFPEDALKYKLVDNLLYWDQVEDRIRAKTGASENDKIKYVSLDEYANKLKAGGSAKTGKGDKIAVLFAEGEITDGSKNSDYQIASEDMVETIRSIRKNDKIKAVVMRVNSPGGSALASEIILRELELLKAKKPLIVSMGDVAASGGYYISSHADSIFAMPNTITGSIGVFSMMFSVEGLMKNKLGLGSDEVKNAPYADFPTMSRDLTADEGQRLQHSVDNIYGIFKNRVSTGRKISEADVDSIAQGRVWTGTDALAIHLIDAYGNLDRALKSAAAKAKLGDYEVVTYPEPVDKLSSLMRKFSRANASTTVMKQALQEELGPEYETYQDIKKLRSMNGKAMMAMPFRFRME
ncbi:signal peptide peptidase SppA [Chitinophagaceae bacterium MMS25-I14]